MTRGMAGSVVLALALALFPGTSAMRQSMLAKKAEEEFNREEAVKQAASAKDKPRKAASAVVASANVSAKEPFTGTHVCCATISKDKKGHLSSSFTVFHESATAEIEKCTITMITGIFCRSPQSCEKECQETLHTDSLFLSYYVRIAKRIYANKLKRIEQDKGQAIAAHEEEIKDREQAYQQELEDSRMTLSEVEEELARGKEKFAEDQVALEELQKAVNEYAEMEKALEEQAASSREAFESHKVSATEKYEADVKEIEGKIEGMSEATQAKLDGVIAKREALDVAVASAKKQTVPTQCRDKNHKPVECCCVIGGMPMKVPTSFNHWDECLLPKPYSSTSMLGWTCSPFQECGKCRAITCGKSMCPVKEREEVTQNQQDGEEEG